MISLVQGVLTPIFTITADGKPFPADRVLSIEITDAAGFESDEAQIVLDNSPPMIESPEPGAKYEIALGYAEWGRPIYVGTYIFEEIERSGFERTVTLICKAADHAETLKEPKTRAFENKTFGDIAGIISGDHGLTLAISEELKAHLIPYAAQTEESDQHFLTRLGRNIGAVIAQKTAIFW